MKESSVDYQRRVDVLKKTDTIPDIYQKSTHEEHSPQSFPSMKVKIKSALKIMKQSLRIIPQKNSSSNKK